MRGGKREGSGRPRVERPVPVSWRAKSHEARQAYIDLGGARWLDKVIDAAIAKRQTQILKAATRLLAADPRLTREEAMAQADEQVPFSYP